MKATFVLTSVLLGALLPAENTRHASYNHAGNLKYRSSVSGPVGSVYILIDKSEYALSVYDNEGWYATYPVVFGSKDP